MQITAVFDIGKTNKKFILFDEHFQPIHQEQITVSEIKDDDGYPCDDLATMEEWVIDTFKKAMSNPAYQITRLNFSTYGATIVNLDEAGKPATSLYNYLKPYPPELQQQFMNQNGGEAVFCMETASPALGMLNSGLQLYWLKHNKSQVFAQIHRTLHLPQYFAFLFTGRLNGEFTTVGCHTGLWDFKRNTYHNWVQKEGITPLLPEVRSASTSCKINWNGYPLEVGIGINDTSANLVPYMMQQDASFLLLSTGTWSIALYPFSKDPLTPEELQQDCLYFIRHDGRPVKVARLFLGNEYQLQVRDMTNFFSKPEDYHKQIRFDYKIYSEWRNTSFRNFKWKSLNLSGIKSQSDAKTDFSVFHSFEEAYHQLMIALTDIQIQRIRLALGTGKIRKLFVDGGFVNNEVFLELLKIQLADTEIITSHQPIGSATGAAMVMNISKIKNTFQDS